MRAFVWASALCLIGTAAAACTPPEAACETPLGTYHIALPSAPKPPTVLFLHGAGGTSDGVFRMRGMIKAITDRGYAVIAPQGLSWRGRRGGIWSFLPETQRPRARDEAAFFAEVIDHAARTHGTSKEPAILAGFSAGGFMVNYLACETPQAFAAYAPVAGGFWRPHPDSCTGPLHLFHTHGWRDSTVPLEGRPLGSAFLQGDVFEGLGLWRDTNGCDSPAPDAYKTTEQFMRRAWDCNGYQLEMALFPGGHRVPEGWADVMLDWYEALPED